MRVPLYSTIQYEVFTWVAQGREPHQQEGAERRSRRGAGPGHSQQVEGRRRASRCRRGSQQPGQARGSRAGEGRGTPAGPGAQAPAAQGLNMRGEHMEHRTALHYRAT